VVCNITIAFHLPLMRVLEQAMWGSAMRYGRRETRVNVHVGFVGDTTIVVF
jgi:hypothetical protein